MQLVLVIVHIQLSMILRSWKPAPYCQRRHFNITNLRFLKHGILILIVSFISCYTEYKITFINCIPRGHRHLFYVTSSLHLFFSLETINYNRAFCIYFSTVLNLVPWQPVHAARARIATLKTLFQLLLSWLASFLNSPSVFRGFTFIARPSAAT